MKVEEEKGESGEELVMKPHSFDKVEKRKSAFFLFDTLLRWRHALDIQIGKEIGKI